MKMNIEGDYIIKFWGDSPIITNDVCNFVIGEFLFKYYGFDFISNNHPNTYPEGMQLEIIKKSLLIELNKTELSQFHREHVTTAIWMNEDIYKIANVIKLNATNMKYRLVLDYYEDLLLIKKLLQKFDFNSLDIKLSDLELYLDQHPEINSLNKNYIESEEEYYKRILGK
jgi:spore coat polysaccharide biosynthesis protein SpsF